MPLLAKIEAWQEWYDKLPEGTIKHEPKDEGGDDEFVAIRSCDCGCRDENITNNGHSNKFEELQEIKMNEMFDVLLEDVTKNGSHHSHVTFELEGKRYSVIVLKGDSTVCGLMLSNLAKTMEENNAVMDDCNRTVIK